MEPYYADESVTLHHGDCLDVLATLPDASVDAVVTDPPYGLEFMGKDWDAPWKASSVGRGVRVASERADELTERGKGHATSAGPYLASGVDSVRVAGRPFQEWCEVWSRECLRVLKPGGHLLAFGGTRTWHRLACAVEDAGFEVRDSIAWLYGSGFPKSLNLVDEDGERTGWGTALKPAFEPVVVARKPLAGTVAANVLEHGTGALNIDACRVEGEPWKAHSATGLGKVKFFTEGETPVIHKEPHTAGRWPANVVLDESQAEALDEQSGTLTSGANPTRRSADGDRQACGTFGGQDDANPQRGVDVGGASRFFYVAKADASERPRVNGTAHPTVKPLALMRWLVRLVTPPGGTVLELFAGSGTTVEACIVERFRCIAIEREVDYLPLIESRIARRRDPVKAITLAGEDLGLFGEASA